MSNSPPIIAPASRAPATAADLAHSDQMVLGYLSRRGFRQSHTELQQELAAQQTADSSLDHFIFDSQLMDTPTPLLATSISAATEEASAVVESYQHLLKFIEESLDLYKSELQSVLYPLFVHVYLDLISRGFQSEASRFFDSYKQDFSQHFPSDILQFSAITDPLHVRQNAFAILYRQNKYTLLMSSYAFELLLSYLMDSHFMTLLKLVNQYINIKVYSTKPLQAMRQDSTVVGITGHTSQQIQSANQQKVYSGFVPPQPSFFELLERRLKQLDSSAVMQENWNAMKAETTVNEPPPIDEVVPLPPKTNQDIVDQIEAINDYRTRIKISPVLLPSVVTYTFHNTYNSLISLAFSKNSEMAATGFSDSYIRVWSLNGQPLRSLKGTTEYSAADFEKVDSILDGCESEGQTSKRLIGHFGPVYDVAFSPDNKFLLSGSEDGTARLWSMNTFTNLVAYKGHNYPIWGVDYGPMGHYFATASHDRTARIWSTEKGYALRIFAGHLSDVECVKFHPNSNYIVTSSADRTIRLWSIHRGKCVRLFTSSMSSAAGSGGVASYLPGHPTKTSTILSVAISPDGYFMASGGDDGSIVVWELGSGKVLKRYGCSGKKSKKTTAKKDDRLEEVSLSAVYSLDFSADGGVLCAGYADGHVRVFDVKGSDGEGVLVPERDDLISDFCTKRTPVHRVQFTSRNLILSGGPFIPY